MLDLKAAAEKLPPSKRFAVILHDEMSVRHDLVYDRRSNQMIGFINPDAWSFEKVSPCTV